MRKHRDQKLCENVVSQTKCLYFSIASMITVTYKREHLNGGLLIVSEDESMS